MAGPGGVERGRISIRVLPATNTFSRDLERYLNRIEKRLRLEIPVHLDTSAIGREVVEARTQAQRAARQIDIPVRVDPKASRSVERDIQKLSRNLAQRIRDVSTVYSATVGPALDFVRSTARVAVVAGAASAALVGGAGLVGALTAFTVAATGAAGAAPLIVPGIASLLAITGTLKVALSGVGDAIDEALGKDAFAKISPQAERFVKAVKGIAPQLLRVRNAIQGALFDRLAEQVRPLAERYLPTLERAGAGIARVFNGALLRGLRSVNNSTDQWRLAAVLEQARRSLSAFAPVLSRLPRVLLQVGEAAAPAFTKLARGLSEALSGVLDRLAASASSGDLNDAITGALSVIGDIALTLLRVLGTIKGIGDAASRAFGTNLTSPLAAAAKAMERFVNSAPGQDFLTGIFVAVKPVLADLGTLVGSLAGAIGRLVPVAAGLASAFLQGLAPVVPVAERLASALGGALTSILPALSDVAVVLGETLASALEALGPALPIVAGGLAALAQAVGGGLQSFFTTVAPLMPRIAEGFAGLARSLGNAFASAIISLGPAMPALADAFINLAAGLGEILPQVVEQLAAAFVTMAPHLPEIALALTNIASALAQLTPQMVTVLSGIGVGLEVIASALNTPGAGNGPLLALLGLGENGQGTQAGAGVLPQLLQRIAEIKAALGTLNGIGAAAVGPFLAQMRALPVLVGGALAGVIPAIISRLGGVPAAITGALRGAAPAMLASLGGLPGLAAGAVGPLPGMVALVLTGVPARLAAIWRSAVSQTRMILSTAPAAAVGAVAPLVGRVAAAVANLPGTLLRIAVSAVASLISGLGRAPGAAGSAMAGVGPAIVAALAGVAGAAFSAGASIVSSIASGILSQIGQVAAAAGRIAGAIKDRFPNSPVAEGPLRVLNSRSTNPGGQIAKMIAAGLRAELGAVRSAADVTAEILAASFTDAGGVDAAVRNVTGVVADAASARYATPAAGAVPTGGVVFNAPVTTADVDELTAVIRWKQQDAAAVYSIAALAAVGGV